MTAPAPSAPSAPADNTKTSNFLRQIIERDLDRATYAQRQWGGSPGDAAHHQAQNQPDPAKIRTRPSTSRSRTRCNKIWSRNCPLN